MADGELSLILPCKSDATSLCIQLRYFHRTESESELKVVDNFQNTHIRTALPLIFRNTHNTRYAMSCGEVDGPMILGYCCGGKQIDDDIYLDTHSSVFSGSYTAKSVSDDDSVATSVVAAVNDLASGKLVLELGADLVRSASEMVIGQGLQVLKDIEFDAGSDTSSFFTHDDVEDGEDTSTYVRMDDMTLISIRSGSTAEVTKEESPALTPSEKAANAHSAAVSALHKKQADALEELRRLGEEKRSVDGDTPVTFCKNSVMEELLEEADEEDDESSGGETDDAKYANMGMSITQATESVGKYPTPLVVHQIPPPPTPPPPPEEDSSSTNALPPDFVPFWLDPPAPQDLTPATPAWVLKREEAKRKKAAREQKLLKAVPSFLRKGTFGRKK